MNEGAPCTNCGSTALDCQHTFRSTRNWCCKVCQRDGAAALHVTKEPRRLDPEDALQDEYDRSHLDTLFDQESPRVPAVIFDRDGTLFSVAHHMDADGPICWHCYNGLIAFDAPVPLIAALFHAIRPGITKIVTSGRMESSRPGMLAAMRKHDLVPDVLLMRADKDQRKDSIVKREIYEREIAPFYDVRYVVDDRPSVCDEWRDLGLPVLQVTDPGILPRITR